MQLGEQLHRSPPVGRVELEQPDHPAGGRWGQPSANFKCVVQLGQTHGALFGLALDQSAVHRGRFRDAIPNR